MDMLHPLAVLQWECCHKWTKRVVPMRCEVLHDIVCVLSQGKVESCDDLYISTDLNSWTSITLPCQHMSFATYQSKFVAVGGRHPSTYEVTNKVWTSDTGEDWQPSLPPMPTKRCHTSSVSTKISPELLVVVGGQSSGGKYIDVVEVLLREQWNTVDPLPTPCWNVRSTFHEGNIYLMGGWGQNYYAYSCTATMLLMSCEEGISDGSSLWRKFKAPGEHTTPASYLSRLISIDQWCTVRAYNNVAQSWVETTEIRTTNGSYTPFVAVAVLQSGEWIVVHRYYGVNKIKLLASTFHSDDKFISNVLSRLEAVIGIGIVSTIAKVYLKLTSKSEVKLEEGIDTRGHRTFLPDPQVYPEKHVIEVISQWSAGRSVRPPTWKELLTVLEEVGLLDLSKHIQAFIKGEINYMNAYQYFITTKDTLEMQFLKFIFLGPPRLGKTTARRRLTGEIIDLKSAGEAEQTHPSTGTVKSGPSVMVRSLSSTTAVITESEWTALLALKNEACFLFQTLSNVLDSSIQTSDNSCNTVSTQSVKAVEESVASTILSSEVYSNFTDSKIPVSDSFLTQSSGKDLKEIVDDLSEVVAIFKEAMESKHWQDVKRMFKAYLRMEDTGGQPELMDMLPALTVGPGLYLLFFNLQYSLNKCYTLTYCDNVGESSIPVQSTYTVKEMFLSSLSSISCSNAHANDMSSEETISPDLKKIMESSKSVAYLIGTHKDMVKEEDIAEFDKQIQEVIRSTKFFEQDIVKFCSQDRLLVAIDNMRGGAEEVKEIRKLLEECIENQFKKLRIPAVWLVFSLCLRKRGVKTASFKSCLKLSEKLNMSLFEIKVALWFLHHHAGIIMYFPDIPELSDLVIIDSQVVYDSVTELILKCLKFRNRQAAAERFKETGLFSLKELQAATCKVSQEYLPPIKLIALLKYLHIIAYVYPSEPQASCDNDEKDSYIMPCMLENAGPEELDCFQGSTWQNGFASSLMIRYNCGFVPIGVFPAMMACLIGRNVFKFIRKGIKKNRVQFYYGTDYDKITLIARPTFYEIRLFRQSKTKNLLHIICKAVMEEIVSSLKIVGSQMNYGCYMDYQFAFECPSLNHLCVIDMEDQIPHKMLCLIECGPQDLAASHLVWFGQPYFKESSCLNTLPSLSHIPTMSQLTLLKWRDETGHNQKLKILQEISSNWEEAGNLMGLSSDVLDSIEKNYSRSVEQCCRNVFRSWLEEGEKGVIIYPVSWEGICTLLEDMDYSSTALLLRDILGKD